ncbi:transmembrane protein 26 [Agrilus planipennis]|uniref:Transmembrane protein 26 n=1 Tax=Agrilus planipennis TaxID=224129 RepID=A0A1W4W5S7_AGRPL|nr:transmembrane protein 26 [Agrilus planipennis]
MSKIFAVIKAIITRLVFAGHGVIAVWQVTIFKKNTIFWYLTSPIILLFFEGLFTLTVKENQEWKWFCPSVFLYLASVVPAIWLLELDKVDKRLKTREETFNLTASAEANLKDLKNLIGVQIQLPDISLSTETWISLVEQFLMLILIIGRWMLPKGDLTRDQLSQLLLVYIGTAADIIEFFDSFKDDKVASEPVLVLLTLSIWTWSLMQFTVVLTATKSRKSRMASSGNIVKNTNSCCTIDVWGIALNITLQDAPFLVFRLLLITHFKIISYMNVFFTCKNTLVILLQLYRLYVVYSEFKKQTKKNNFNLTSISIISKPNIYGERTPRMKKREKVHKHNKRYVVSDISSENSENYSETCDFSDRERKSRKCKTTRKDTGYSTGSSFTSNKNKQRDQRSIKKQTTDYSKAKNHSRSSDHSPSDYKSKKGKQKLQRSDRDTRGHKRIEEESEETQSNYSFESMDLEASNLRKEKERKMSKSRSMKDITKKHKKSKNSSNSFSDPSTE